MSEHTGIRVLFGLGGALVLALAGAGRLAIAQAPQLSVQDRVAAALSALLTDSQAALRHYEWIETAIVTLRGEVRSRKQERCYYGPDGTLKRDDVYSSGAPKAEPREAGRIETGRTDLAEALRNALSLVDSYIPLSPTDMQAARRAARLTVLVLQPGKRVRVKVLDYHKVGDEVEIEIDLVKSQILRITVTTYLDSITDVVSLDATMGQLSGGTAYPAAIMLEERTRSLNVAVRDTGYRMQY